MSTVLPDLWASGSRERLVTDALSGPGWGVFPHFVPSDAITELTQECRALWEAGCFRHAGVGRGESFRIAPDIRNDRVMWLEPVAASPTQRWWLSELEVLKQGLNRSLFLGLDEFEGHFAVYPPGSYYRRHLDQFKGVRLRTVTCILYLNKRWQAEYGGQLRLYLDNEEEDSNCIDIQPEAGTFVCFLSDSFVHEVLPSRRQRLAITGWFKKRSLL